VIESLPIEQLKQIAIDFYKGLIFSDRHCESADDIRSTFMTLMFITDPEQIKEIVENSGLIFEYISNAGPLAVNGRPVFMSMRLLNRKDTDLMFDMAKKLLESEQALLAEGN